LIPNVRYKGLSGAENDGDVSGRNERLESGHEGEHSNICPSPNIAVAKQPSL